MHDILIVEDDNGIRRFVSVNLMKRDYTVREAADGKTAITLMQERMPDLLVVDLILPGINGTEVCAWVRERSQAPIIVISAQEKEEMKVEVLDLGADDYVTKPFGINELLARTRALLRRSNLVAGERQYDQIIIEGIVIDLRAKRVFVDGNDIHMTRTEFEVLAYLAQGRDEILTHQEILTSVWGPEYRDSNHYLHVYLGRIRTKLTDKYNGLLETISGLGYILHSKNPYVNVT